MPPARRVLILVPLLMAAALIGTVLTSYFSVHDVLATLARGQGDAMLDSIRHGRSTDPAFLETLLREQGEEGLRCIAVLDAAGQPIQVVGDCLTRDPATLRAVVRGARSDEVIKAGSRVRMVRGSLRPEGELDAGSGQRARGRGAILIELEPLLTRQLEHGAIRSLGIGGAASLALVLVAVGLWRFSAREERMKERLERDRRLASLGEMAAVLAHEIRNPLTAMKGHAQLLAERLAPDSPEKTQGRPGGARGGAARGADRRSAELHPLGRDRARGGRSGGGAPRRGAGRGRRRRRPDRPRARRRPRALAARRAAAPAGPDQPAAQRPPGHRRRGGRGRRRWRRSPTGPERGGALVFTVRDHGRGVPAGERERIFEPFFTTRTRGTGLGLAVARRIVELHGGTISVADHPEGGALFRVTIPRSGRPGAGPDPSPGSPARSRGRSPASAGDRRPARAEG